ncbi:ANK_REP_REGION domain-containing protein [Trichoderma simmonsii]|uniref:ANK_REP_REGION domain-containing protein n=1 Tax=Trichoderma simmonsii TaxID=1491479 RepID=A0A8G0LP30_9HYPO|nr:ANK_REP_REGION domain-containing protein [Trichoderma simmonsii]
MEAPESRKRTRIDDGAVSIRSKRHQSNNGDWQRLDYRDYTVGWVCALPIEMAAAEAMLDSKHALLPQKKGDSNTYTFGRIGEHNVVIACLPSSQYGTNNAATVASNMSRSFSSITIRLMVGIGGGVPDGGIDIRLGDVVVGNEVMQYDLGKVLPDGHFQRTGRITTPPHTILTAVSKLQADHESAPSRIPSILLDMLDRNEQMTSYARPSLPDRLFCHTYKHTQEMDSCERCSLSEVLDRPRRVTMNPRIYYGKIASGNQVVKDGETRAKMAEELGIICFEMEAAGLHDFPCLAIRGICDYSDSHKNKAWQKYSAAVAAAYAKELLSVIPAQQQRDTEATYLTTNPALLQSQMEAVLGSLTFEQIDSRHATIKTQHSKTCQWLLDHPKYVKWLEPIQFTNHHGFLWINGKPGAGKSTLMKFAYTNAKNKWRATADATVISFFFNARGVQLEKSTEGMYRSLLFQVIQKFPDVLHDSDHIFQARHNQATWDIETLQALFTHAVTRLGQRQITCFIDALDECDISEVEDMVEYFEDLGDQAAKSQTKIYICFSSRHYPHIEIRNGLKLTLEDQPGHAEDLEKYVRSKLRADKSKAAFQEVSTEILERASGVFLWVVLVVDILNRELRDGRMWAVKRRLRELPDGLSNLFKDILCRDNHNMDDLLLCIQWILYAARPLTCEEYYFALVSGLDPSPENLAGYDREYITPTAMELYLLSSSKGLAELVKSKARTVQFIHESVRDFLIKDNGIRELWPNHAASFESYSHDRLKQCCDNYCNIDISERVPQSELLPKASSKQAKELRTRVSEEFPFLDYAAQHVLHHANAAEDGIAQVAFLKNFSLKRWLHLYNLFQQYEVRRYTAEASLVYILAQHNLPSLVRSAVNNGFDAHLKGERYGYPLLAALENGHEEVYKTLLPHCTASENIIDQNDYHKGFSIPRTTTVLHYAAEHGNLLLLTHLLGFMTPTSDESDRRQGRTPLSYAASSGSEACLRALLSCGAHIEAANKDGLTPLSYAVLGSKETAIRLLLDRGAQIDAADEGARTPLMYAAGCHGDWLHGSRAHKNQDRGNQAHGNQVIVRLLLDRGAQVETADKDGRTPLMYAAGCHGNQANGNEVIARLLLDQGAQVETADKDGRTPLMYAAGCRGNEAVVRLLLDRGAQIEAVSNEGRTSLSYAVQVYENRRSLRLWSGAQFKIRRTPLSIVAHWNHNEAAVRLLLDRGAQIEVADKDGRTPLSYAAGDNFRGEAIVRLLLDRGAQIEAASNEGRTPLSYATGNHHQGEAIVRLLLDRGAQIEAASDGGRTPLSYAHQYRNDTVTRLLQSHGAKSSTVYGFRTLWGFEG